MLLVKWESDGIELVLLVIFIQIIVLISHLISKESSTKEELGDDDKLTFNYLFRYMNNNMK